MLFDKRSDGRTMMRIYNYDEISTATMNMNELMNSYNIRYKKLLETGIDFNFRTVDMNNWEYKWNQKKYPNWLSGPVILEPLQIRTFEVHL